MKSTGRVFGGRKVAGRRKWSDESFVDEQSPCAVTHSSPDSPVRCNKGFNARRSSTRRKIQRLLGGRAQTSEVGRLAPGQLRAGRWKRLARLGSSEEVRLNPAQRGGNRAGRRRS
jgi:hypothetical protein